jgi:hypothetical protein
MNIDFFKKIVEEELVSFLENGSFLQEKDDKSDLYAQLPKINKPPASRMTSAMKSDMQNLVKKWQQSGKADKFKEKFPGEVVIGNTSIPRWRSYMWAAAGAAARARASKGARSFTAAKAEKPTIDPKTGRAQATARKAPDGTTVEKPSNAVPLTLKTSTLRQQARDRERAGVGRKNIEKRAMTIARQLSKLDGVTVDDKGNIKIPSLTLGKMKRGDLGTDFRTFDRIKADASGREENPELRDKIFRDIMKGLEPKARKSDATKKTAAAMQQSKDQDGQKKDTKSPSDTSVDIGAERDAAERRRRERASGGKLSADQVGMKDNDEYQDFADLYNKQIAGTRGFEDAPQITGPLTQADAKKVADTIRKAAKAKDDMLKSRGGQYTIPDKFQKFLDSQEKTQEESYQGGNFKITNSETDIDNKNALKLKKIMSVLEASTPTDPKKWAAAVSSAKQRFNTYPSAYANLWAAKKYKQMGGKWRMGK